MPAIIVDPALLAAVTRQFQLRGTLDPFNLTENVVPVFDIGQLTGTTPDPRVVTTLAGSQGVRVGTLDRASPLTVVPAEIDDEDVNDGDVVVNPAAAQVIRSTGQLTAGNHWLWAEVATNVDTAARLVWRNAANNADLATWTVLQQQRSSPHVWGPWNVRVETNERFNIIPVAAIVGTMSGNITAAPISPSLAA